jgi:hypothetical protein
LSRAVVAAARRALVVAVQVGLELQQDFKQARQQHIRLLLAQVEAQVFIARLLHQLTVLIPRLALLHPPAGGEARLARGRLARQPAAQAAVAAVIALQARLELRDKATRAAATMANQRAAVAVARPQQVPAQRLDELVAPELRLLYPDLPSPTRAAVAGARASMVGAAVRAALVAVGQAGIREEQGPRTPAAVAGAGTTTEAAGMAVLESS